MPPQPRIAANPIGYAFIAALFLLVVALGVWAWQHPPDPDASARAGLRIGYQTSPAMALVMIAEAKDMANGKANAKVVWQHFQAGKFALQAFLGGSLDVAVVGDVPIGLALLQGQKFTAFAEVVQDSVDEVRMVVRNPGNCDPAHPWDYFMAADKPKRIATSFGGGPQYFAVEFLEKYGIPLHHVELLPYAPGEMAAAILSRSVDGAAIFDPAAARIEGLLGPESCTFTDPKAYRQHYIAVTQPPFMAGKKVDPRLAAFVAALRAAQDFAAKDPAAAMAIVQQETQIDAKTLSQIWPKFTFGVTLDPGLQRLWMEEADFFVAQPDGGTFPPEVQPDYKAVLNDAALRCAPNCP
jgi:NitT/TauT family transport system substrate-binding protein